MSLELDENHFPPGVHLLDYESVESVGRSDFPQINQFAAYGATCTVQHNVSLPRANQAPTQLTVYEETCLVLGAAGLTRTATALALDRSPETIHTHQRTGMDKLGVNAPSALCASIRKMVELGIIWFEDPVPTPTSFKIYPTIPIIEQFSEGMSRSQVAEQLPSSKHSLHPVRSKLSTAYGLFESPVHDPKAAVFCAIGSGLLSVKTPDGPAVSPAHPNYISPPLLPGYVRQLRGTMHESSLAIDGFSFFDASCKIQHDVPLPPTERTNSHEVTTLSFDEESALLLGILGLDGKTSATALQKGATTIKKLRGNAYEKLGVEGRHALAASVHKLVELEIIVIDAPPTNQVVRERLRGMYRRFNLVSQSATAVFFAIASELLEADIQPPAQQPLTEEV